MRSSKYNINFLSLLIILPVFWFIPINNYVYYAASLIVTVVLWWNKPNVKVRIDPFFYWLLGFLCFVMILDLVAGGGSLRMTATLLYCFSIILYIVLVGITKNEIILASFIGIATIYIIAMITGHLSDVTTASYLGAVIVLLMLTKRYRLALLFFVLSFILLTRAALLAMTIVLSVWYILRIYKSQSRALRRGILLTLIAGLTITPMILGKYFFDDPYIFVITTGKSYLYSILWNDIVSRGIDVLFPVSNIYAIDVVSANLSDWSYQGSMIYEEGLRFFGRANGQCPHSTYMEFFVNYGVISFVTMFVLFICIETRTSWPVVAYFIIAIGFQCESFTPRYIIPFYILYRSTYFIKSNGFGTELNALCTGKS